METNKRQVNEAYVYENLMITDFILEYGYKQITEDFNKYLGEHADPNKPALIKSIYYNEKTGDKVMLMCSKSIFGTSNDYTCLNKTEKDKKDGCVIKFLLNRPEITGGDIISFIVNRLGEKVFDPIFEKTNLYHP